MKESLLSHIKDKFDPLMFNRFSSNENSGVLEPSRSLSSEDVAQLPHKDNNKEEEKKVKDNF